ncbi:alpha-glucuronidase [Flavobacterium flavigenum]|uniref:alpha-glucuronidase n=1 Tax=Flavobacterium flavigenum TaxID=3003258 RepID=UPI0024825D3E|nr:alpha-glucuronidase [Flavobacterium flavigenum]
MNLKKIAAFLILISTTFNLHAEDGHLLWLRAKSTGKVTIVCSGKSSTLAIAKKELEQSWQGKNGAKLLLSIKKSKAIKGDGFKLSENEIQANTELGILYGVYELLRRQQTGEEIQNKIYNPSYERRILNHWDNLDGSVERGYAGKSIFWHDMEKGFTITDKDRILWKEYARANASIGINGAVLNNVNSSKLMLTTECLQKVKAISEVLRPYGIKTYLSVKFSSPALIGGLKTSDPLNTEVIKWWKDKTKEIYKIIPDFGGFLIKANSEGEPGPQDFERTHADGANMLADVVKPYGGIIMWRAFVYEINSKDRAAQAYNEFMPLDGQFRDNVIIQVKNGPVDFQPREPFNPLFGAMKKTSVMPELQITQEYLGHSEQLVYLAKMWEEFLKSDTYQEGVGSTVALTTDGSLFPQKYTAIAGVANIGLDVNWCGHHFAQSNWYAFGRMAWNNQITSEKIVDEWLKLTFSPIDVRDSKPSDWKKNFLEPVKQLMLESHEATVNYSMPLGLHHIFAGLNNTHYGSGPWFEPKGIRTDWTAAYYHKADVSGIGFDRTAKGSGAVSQYHEPLKSQFENIETCPEIYLLWFHHLPWDYKMKNGRILWDELCYTYDKGVKEVREFQKIWDKAQPYMDEQRFFEVQSKLRRQSRDAQIWKDGCLLYFQQFSKRPIPFDIERPVYDLDYLSKTDLTDYLK